MISIEDFLVQLAQKKNTRTVFNPYLDDDIVNNLRLYLNAMTQVKGKKILLVGEAPGYKGCKITGIPFTSGDVFKKFNHPILRQIKDKIVLSKVESENTATIVWEYLSRKRTIPLFWNSFPYHPHPKVNNNKNRAPTSDEIEVGMSFLQSLYLIFQPELVAGIGNKGVESAKKAFPDCDIAYIRHPSFGGKADFIKGMNKIL